MTETETISGAGLSGANPQPDTIADKKKQSKIELAVVNIICLLIFMAFGYIAIMSFFQTSVFDPAEPLKGYSFVPKGLLLCPSISLSRSLFRVFPCFPYPFFFPV